MVPALIRGRLGARLTTCKSDIAMAQELRRRAFHGSDETDCDSFDARCLHLLIEDHASGRILACCRLLPLNATQIGESYSAQYYELSALEGFEGEMLELGRFCVEPGERDADILRLSWAMLTRYVDENAIKMLFGCSSFTGTDAALYRDSFAMLRERHLAPEEWSPRVKAAQVFHFGEEAGPELDVKRAMQHMPPLLRTYLAMGGWVSDHAVVDRKMNTLHVFTGLEVAAIPPARKRLLRAVAA